MKELMMCAVVVLIALFLFISFGSLILKCLRQRFRLTFALIIGFFGYFFLFQFFYLPAVLLQIKLSLLSVIWMSLTFAVVMFAVFWCRKIWQRAWSISLRKLKRNKWGTFLVICTLLLILFELYYMVRYGYNGYDTQYYIGTVATSVYTDHMFLYDAATGNAVSELPLRYALSGFYINAAVWSQVFHLVPALCMRYVIGTLCCLLANSILFEIGRLFFTRKKTENACWVVMLGIGLNFFFRTMYTTSEFLLLRSYEAKAYCANVVLPALFLICISIWKHRDHNKWWVYLGIITGAAVSVSMSSILTAPAMVTIMLIGRMLFQNKQKRIGSYLLCMIPCVGYLGLYLLSLAEILVIKV